MQMLVFSRMVLTLISELKQIFPDFLLLFTSVLVFDLDGRSHADEGQTADLTRDGGEWSPMLGNVHMHVQ